MPSGTDAQRNSSFAKTKANGRTPEAHERAAVLFEQGQARV
jgi:hypothetical protein